jgi:hypothetical protein
MAGRKPIMLKANACSERTNDYAKDELAEFINFDGYDLLLPHQ